MCSRGTKRRIFCKFQICPQTLKFPLFSSNNFNTELNRTFWNPIISAQIKSRYSTASIEPCPSMHNSIIVDKNHDAFGETLRRYSVFFIYYLTFKWVAEKNWAYWIADISCIFGSKSFRRGWRSNQLGSSNPQLSPSLVPRHRVLVVFEQNSYENNICRNSVSHVKMYIMRRKRATRLKVMKNKCIVNLAIMDFNRKDSNPKRTLVFKGMTLI